MRIGEAGVVVALAVLIAGGIFSGVNEMPDIASISSISETPVELSVYDQLKLAVQPYHFGNFPRESFRGDTTVWVADLDHNMFSIPQTDLYVTRALRDLGFTDIRAAERASGGIVFNAVFPNGQAIEINLTSP